ncbi:serine/threonine-protein kinase [Streptomyces resistomycificus]|uniref:Serine/threonine protein kinase n=1 Tax=Streptomyces resistomycificus TaxID=67356 RepID=A0A0L8LM22_9ACTN|nr:serine/threonine-protein kinase [Streptomyces resistomycificus]KOG39149.1 serine/threonine protein kinase [Streptomyces resistomycificus]KUN99749.1 serine/threonine protein kinase [Streptomyces resistomycificus]
MPLHKDDPRSVGGYKLLDRLGAGGMGVVYQARSRSGRDLAVKVVHAQYAEDAVFRARFRQEIESVRRVSGAFTAPVVDADPEAARPWMATQYVPGRSLAQRIRDRGALRGGELRQLALGLVDALRDIHRAGVVHRDLKPANVLMAEDGPRVIDFGISRAAENHNTLTETGQMIGTPPFMSPEQLTDARTVGPASDVFSLGALLVYATTGRGPFDADSPYLTAYRVVHDEPVLEGIGQPLRGLLERCLAKEAADRPGLDELAREFAAALPEPAAGDLETVSLRLDELSATDRTRVGILADPGATTDPGRRTRRIRPLLAAAGTVGAVALGLTTYLLLGPGGADSGGGATPATPGATATASRWSAVPSGWKPWRTTVYESAARGVKKAPDPGGGGMQGGPDCQVYEDAAYCTGQGILPVRLDGLTGETTWRAERVPTGKGSYDFTLLGIRDGAVLVQQLLFPENSDDEVTTVFALDTETGERLWHRTVNDDWSDAIAFDDLVVIPGTDGRSVTARSPRTGAERWTAQLPSNHYCGFTEAGGGLYLLCSADTVETQDVVVQEVDPADGSMRRTTVPGEGHLLGVLDGRLLFLEMSRDEDGEMQLGEDAPYDRIRLLDPATGADSTTKLARRYSGEVTLANDTLWFATSSGQVTAVSARTGKQLWQTPTSLEQPGRATYDPRTRAVYLASASGRVGALDARRGTVLWETLPRAQRVDSGWNVIKVRLYGGALVVATPDGTVFTLDPAHPERKPVSG